MVRRHELSDEEWGVLSGLLPRADTGRPRRDGRVVLNGIVWKLRTGSAWRDVPERYGSWRTLYTRFRRWALDGTFTRMLEAVQAQKHAAGDVDWLVSVDSTITRAHQHAADARKKGADPAEAAHAHAIGRPRGGLTTKIHLACDGRGRPLGFVVTGGNINDCTQLEQVLRRSGFAAQARADRAPGLIISWVTRDTAAEIYATTCGNAVSHTPSLNGRTNRRTAAVVAATAAGHPLSTRSATSGATSSSAASTREAVPGHRQPLRQNPRILRSSTHHRVTPDVGITL